MRRVLMGHRFLRVLVLLVFLFSGTLLGLGQTLTILHTNDTHSTLFPYGPQEEYGGIARISTLIKQIRSDGGNVLALNTGDVFVGSFEFNKYLGYPELKIMEGLYNAMCLGNHEFDLGLNALAGVLGGAFGIWDQLHYLSSVRISTFRSVIHLDRLSNHTKF